MFNLEYLLLNLASKSSIVIVLLFLSSLSIKVICSFLTLYDIGSLLCLLISFSSSYLLVHLNKLLTEQLKILHVLSCVSLFSKKYLTADIQCKRLC